MYYRVKDNQLKFNPKPSEVMHLDLNSCFATIEQQANPLLRGKPIAVAAYTTSSGCIIAPSVEAKHLGVKVGMRVREGKAICPSLLVLPPDVWKYRNVHLALRRIVNSYTNDFCPKSIDEFVLNLSDYLSAVRTGYRSELSPIHRVAMEIKARIKKEIGEVLTVSIGIAPNRFLAKVAASLHKPDGLDEIKATNFSGVYAKLGLTDLPWIKIRNTVRLNSVGVFSVLDFFKADIKHLKAAFNSILSYYWYLRLRGWEIDDFESSRKSYGNSYALPKPLIEPQELSPILLKLVEKTGSRLRRAGCRARGIHLAISYRDGSFWHKGKLLSKDLFDSREIYKEAFKLLFSSPYKKAVRNLAVSCFGLTRATSVQLGLFEDKIRKEKLVRAIDKVNDHWGSFVLAPAKMFLADKGAVPDRIAFGGVKELEELVLDEKQ